MAVKGANQYKANVSDNLKIIQMAAKLAMAKQNRLAQGITVFNRATKLNPVTPTDKCYLCGETRQLQQAHIIPSRLFNGLEYEGVEVKQLNDVIILCPTHHRCFDHNELTEDELSIIQPILDKYILVTSKILKSIEIIISPKATKEDKDRLSYKLDIFTTNI